MCCTDDWDIKDAYFEEMLTDEARTDLYVVMSNFGANQVLVEFCCRTSKPVAMNPTKSFGAMSTAPAARRGADILPAFDWPEVARYCRLLRAEKAVRTANILLAPRFDSTTPKAGGNDSFVCLSDVTRKLGCHFRHVNVHELMDMMDPVSYTHLAAKPVEKTPSYAWPCLIVSLLAAVGIVFAWMWLPGITFPVFKNWLAENNAFFANPANFGLLSNVMGLVPIGALIMALPTTILVRKFGAKATTIIGVGCAVVGLSLIHI